MTALAAPLLRPIRLDGRTLAVALSVGLHLTLLAVAGGRWARPVVHAHERLSFSVVARAAPAAVAASSSAPAPVHDRPAGGPRPRRAAASALTPAPSVVDGPVSVAAMATGDAADGASTTEAPADDSGPGEGTPSVGTPGGTGEGTASFDAAGYGRGLHALVAARKNYPVLARRMGLEGRTLVRVRVRDDGTLEAAPEVAKSSGHDLLDREALRMVEAAAPFPAFAGSDRRSLTLVLPIRFALDEA